jgi:hypothetical protein
MLKLKKKTVKNKLIISYRILWGFFQIFFVYTFMTAA